MNEDQPGESSDESNNERSAETEVRVEARSEAKIVVTSPRSAGDGAILERECSICNHRHALRSRRLLAPSYVCRLFRGNVFTEK
jgi:hypothetical protein